MKPLNFVFLILLQSCSNQPIENMPSREGLPDQESWMVNIILTDQGKIRAKIKAGHLEKYNEKEFILLDQNVDADFFNEAEVFTTNLKSLVAEIDEEEDFLVAIGNVVVVTDSGVTLFTDTLSWDNQKEKVFTSDSVIFITEKKDTLYGIGFESDIELNNWQILQPTGVFNER